MKNTIKLLAIIVLVAVIGIFFAAPVYSGGIVDRVFSGGAKNLAKQAVNLIKQAAALQEKAAGIEEKVLALSDRDRRAYQAELERLGFEPPEWLFNDAQALLTGAPPAPESPGGILGFLAGIFGNASSAGNNRNSGRSGGNATAPPDETAAAPSTTAPASTPASTTAPTPTPTEGPASGGPATWTYIGRPLGTSAIRTIAFGNGRFVAVYDGGKMAYSDDGVTWTAVAESTFPARDSEGYIFRVNTIAWGNNRFVAGGNDGKMAYSADGVSWTAVANSTFGESAIQAVAWGNNRFVAVGYSGKMAYSADGVSWTAVADSGIWNYTNSIGETIMAIINAIAFGNNRFVAVGAFGKIAYSADGVRWTAVADSGIWQYITSRGDTITAGVTSIAFGNNRWVAVGSYGKMAYSVDSASWTAAANRRFDTEPIHAIAYGNGRFVAGSDRGEMAYSADGASWTRIDVISIFSPLGRIYAVAYGNGRFIAGNDDGRIAYCDW
jgi:guanyl-specific ribonuclease Sa